MEKPSPFDYESLAVIGTLLKRLRRRVRLYVWIEGLSAAVVVLGVAFWIGLVLDWMLEPPAAVRLSAMGAVAFVVAIVLYRGLFRRAFAPLADHSMALLLEKRFGQFDDSLVTSVELSHDSPQATPEFRSMLAHTRRQAARVAGELPLARVFNLVPVARQAGAALVLLASILIFALLARESFGFWIERLRLSEARWPRRTQLLVDGFPQDSQGRRTENVARGAEFTLMVKADALRKEPPPDVEVRYRLADGTRGRERMVRVGQAILGQDAYQSYRHLFQGLTQHVEFDIVGGDDRVRDLQLRVVERPEIVEMSLQAEYPDYIARPSRSLHVSGAMQFPEGTKLTVRARASKDLEYVDMHNPHTGERQRLELSGQQERRAFQLPLPPLAADQLLLFTLLDADGAGTREPYRLSLHMTPDDAPQLEVSLAGVGTAITPQAKIPLTGNVRDDYGIQRVWLHYRFAEGAHQSQNAQPQPAGQNEYKLEQILDSQSLPEPQRLKPDQKLELAVLASDSYALETGPHIATSQPFVLDVVSENQLHAMLQRRELLLRRRFEAIYSEMTDTRDLMARIDFPIPDPSAADAAAKGQTDLRITRVIQNMDRSGHETLDVAAAFDAIREELVLNRIDTPESSSRLQEGIAMPLKRIGGEMLPPLKAKTESLLDSSVPPNDRQDRLRATIAATDLVLVEMKRVLDTMLELESYNEVLDLLRAILNDQHRVGEQTKQLREKGVRELLEP
jgi:hypothetical protein